MFSFSEIYVIFDGFLLFYSFLPSACCLTFNYQFPEQRHSLQSNAKAMLYNDCKNMFSARGML